MRAPVETLLNPSTTLLDQSNRAGNRKPTVLVVQSEPYVSAALWTLLSRCEFRVVCETTGQAVCALTRSLSPDAVVLDVNLPGMNGLEICRQLKADAETRSIPVLYCSRQKYLADEAMELGAVAFLALPGEIFKLPKCLRAVAKR